MSLLGAGMEVVAPPAECIGDNLAGDIPRNRGESQVANAISTRCDKIALSAPINRSYWPYLTNLGK